MTSGPATSLSFGSCPTYTCLFLASIPWRHRFGTITVKTHTHFTVEMFIDYIWNADLRLAEADIAAQESIHWLLLINHVLFDLPKGALLQTPSKQTTLIMTCISDWYDRNDRILSDSL